MPRWLKRAQRAFDAFARAGLPNRRIEAWHYTDLRNLMRQALPLAPVPGTQSDRQAQRGAPRGCRRSAPRSRRWLSSRRSCPAAVPAGVTVTSLAAALAEGEPALIESLGAAWAGSRRRDHRAQCGSDAGRSRHRCRAGRRARSAAPYRLCERCAGACRASSRARWCVVGAGATFRLNELSLGRGGRVGQTNNVLILDIGDGADVAHTLSLTGTEPGSLRLESFMVKLGAKREVRQLRADHRRGPGAPADFQALCRCRCEGRAARRLAAARARTCRHDARLSRHAATGCESRQNLPLYP